MIITHRDRHGGFSRTQVDRRQVVAHFIGFVSRTVGTRRDTDTKQAGVIVAPTLDAAIVENRARSGMARSNRLGTTSAAKIDGRQIIAHRRDRHTAEDLVAQSELAIAVITPAFDGTVVEQSAGVRKPRRDIDGESPRTQIDGYEIVTHGSRHRTDLEDGIASSQLAISVVTPANDGCIVQQGARMTATRNDFRGRFTGGKLDGRQIGPHFTRTIATTVRVSKTEPEVAAPAFDLTIGETRAGSIVPGADFRHDTHAFAA